MKLQYEQSIPPIRFILVLMLRMAHPNIYQYIEVLKSTKCSKNTYVNLRNLEKNQWIVFYQKKNV